MHTFLKFVDGVNLQQMDVFYLETFKRDKPTVVFLQKKKIIQ